MRTRLALLALLIGSGLAGASAAQSAGGGGGGNCKFSEPINESYSIEKGKIAKCILQGKDPPKDWIARGGMSQMIGAREFGGDQILPTGLKPSNSAVPHYETAGCGYVKSNTKPGGKSDGGSREGACNGGGGDGGSGGGKKNTNNSSQQQQQPAPLVDPTQEETNCMISVTGSLNVNSLMNTLGGNGDGSTCVRGSVGANLCGVVPAAGASGQACSANRDQSTAISTTLPVTLGGAQTGPARTSGNVLLTLPDGRTVNVPSGTTFTVDGNVLTASRGVFPNRGGGNTSTRLVLNGSDQVILTPQLDGEVGLMPNATSSSNPQYNTGVSRVSPNPCAGTGNLC